MFIVQDKCDRRSSHQKVHDIDLFFVGKIYPGSLFFHFTCHWLYPQDCIKCIEQFRVLVLLSIECLHELRTRRSQVSIDYFDEQRPWLVTIWEDSRAASDMCDPFSRKGVLSRVYNFLRYWHGKKVHNTHRIVLFESSPYLKRWTSYDQL